MAFTLELPDTCQWFALCDRPTEYAVQHPTLGLVACCLECARRVASVDIIAHLTDNGLCPLCEEFGAPGDHDPRT